MRIQNAPSNKCSRYRSCHRKLRVTSSQSIYQFKKKVRDQNFLDVRESSIVCASRQYTLAKRMRHKSLSFFFSSSFDAMSSPLLGASISVKFHPDKTLQPPRLQRDQWHRRARGAESAKSIPRLPQLIPIGETRIQSALIRYWSRRRNCWIVFLLKRVVKCFTTGVKRPVALYDGRGELLKLPGTPQCIRELMDAIPRADRLRSTRIILSSDIIIISTRSCQCKNSIFRRISEMLHFAPLLRSMSGDS